MHGKNCLHLLGYCAAFWVCKFSPSPRTSRQMIKKGNKYINKIVLFLTAYVVYSNVIAIISLFPCANILNNFAELGRLCGYESSSDGLRYFSCWRASDLLVWNSADTTCKRNDVLNISLNLKYIMLKNTIISGNDNFLWTLDIYACISSETMSHGRVKCVMRCLMK